MTTEYGPRITTDGLKIYLDASATKSYPGSGNTWYDLSGNNNNLTLNNSPEYSLSNQGYFIFNGSNQYGTFGKTGTQIGLTTGSTMTVGAFVYVNDLSSDYVHIVDSTSSRWHLAIESESAGSSPYLYINGSTYNSSSYLVLPGYWYYLVGVQDTTTLKTYVNSELVHEVSSPPSNLNQDGNIMIGRWQSGSRYYNGCISNVQIYNKALNHKEILSNYLAIMGRYSQNEQGSFTNPYSSPIHAQSLSAEDGNYYFKSSSMAFPQLLEYKSDYYEGKPWVCVFRSPYNSVATTNKLGLSLPMGGLLVQRDTLDLRAAVYWSNPITYNAVGGSGNNTADSGYSPRRVILGAAGGHGIYATNQNQCNWSNGVGAIGAGWNGSTCGSFPDGLLWGTGQSNTATYANMSGVWSHWIYWE